MKTQNSHWYIFRVDKYNTFEPKNFDKLKYFIWTH